MSKPLSAKAYANSLTKALGKRFPVEALEYWARQRDPIVKMFTWIDYAGNRGSAKERLSVVA